MRSWEAAKSSMLTSGASWRSASGGQTIREPRGRLAELVSSESGKTWRK
jgi:hypothetical protein